MTEPWKVIICGNEDCMREALDEEGNVREGHHIYPDVDGEEITRFTCPRCGKVEIWGKTRKQVARVLYHKLR